MKTMNLRHIYTKVMTMATAVLIAACSPGWESDMMIDHTIGIGENPGERVPSKERRDVLLLYSAGHNSLSSYLKEDISDLCSGWLPGNRRSDDILLIYSHLPASHGNYRDESMPALCRIYKDGNGETSCDTLVTYESGTISASAEQLNRVLAFVKEAFPARGYGMIFSSHATGYLPEHYYQKPGDYVYQEKAGQMSVGQDVHDGSSHEIDLRDFAEAIPYKLDYILFDACLMGGIEVAYELAGKCGKVGYSQAEVLAEGFNYSTLSTHLLQNEAPDPESVCDDYFQQYDIQEGVYRSATISLIDCDSLEPLAALCKELFNTYRAGLDAIQTGNVQRFYRSGKHWFYDLESIIVNAGASEADLARLHEVLDACVLYKGHTPSFMKEFDIHTFSGFSMYLPKNGSRQLDLYYKTLKWNKATDLVL